MAQAKWTWDPSGFQPAKGEGMGRRKGKGKLCHGKATANFGGGQQQQLQVIQDASPQKRGMHMQVLPIEIHGTTLRGDTFPKHSPSQA